MDERTCETCESLFTPDSHHPKAKTCSVACSQRRVSRMRKERREARRFVDGICAKCGDGFKPGKFSANQIYCGKRCRNREMSARFLKRHPARSRERVRRSRWGGNWQRAMDRDEWCVLCTSRDKLNVHHRDGSGSDCEPNHNLENLEVLCATCHKRMHTITWRVVDDEIRVSGLVFIRMGTEYVRVEAI